MARPTIPAGYEAITFAKALQTLEKLVTQNHDFDFFERKIQVQATYLDRVEAFYHTNSNILL